MKKQAYMIISAIMLITIAGLSSVKAQSSSTQLNADIPFEFSVGHETLPAGEYTVRCINVASDMRVLQIRTHAGRTSVMVRTHSVIGKTQDDAKLVFIRYGDHYFFNQAWLPADSIGMQVSKSKDEKRIARELAGTKHSKELVTVAAR